jgi:hypothetical protein
MQKNKTEKSGIIIIIIIIITTTMRMQQIAWSIITTITEKGE